MSGVLDFLLDLILEWDEIPSYEHLVDVDAPARHQILPLPPVLVVERVKRPGFGVIEVHSKEEVMLRRALSVDRMSYEEYHEQSEPTRGRS